MSEIRPFRGLRARNDLAAQIIALPYDVLSRDEARALVEDNPHSFLHITRSDADLPDSVDAHGPEAHAAARAALDRFVANGWLVQDAAPCFYLYEQTWKGRTQVGLMAACSVDEYNANIVKKHELTRPDKEQDRVDHMRALDAQVGLVFLAYRDQPAIAQVLAAAQAVPEAWHVQTDDGVLHRFRVVSDAALVARIQAAFADLPALYIADGHHRSAAASRVCASAGGAGQSPWFLCGIFPDSQLEVLAYNRQVADLHGHTPAGLRAALAEHFVLTEGVAPLPEGRGRWTMYLEGAWWGLQAKPGVVPDDPVGCLDAAVLQDRVLGPLLGIDDPRTNQRVHFVGGIRGHQALSDAVDQGRAAVAFHLHPTGMDQLFAVADADRLMPPKSTWFEPKLRGGVVAHPLGLDR